MIMDPLKLDKPRFHTRVLFAIFAGFIICFGTALLALPLAYLAKEISIERIPWPRIGLVCLSVPFGAMVIWAGLRYRIWIFPYQFTVDRSKNVCGYSWNDSWVAKTELSGIGALITAPAYSRHRWPWVIYATFKGEHGRKVVFRSPESCSDEESAFERSFAVCQSIANHLAVPIEFDQWSPEILAKHTSGR